MKITQGPEIPGASVAPEAQPVPVEVTPTSPAEPAVSGAIVGGEITAPPVAPSPVEAPPAAAPVPEAPLPETPLAPVIPAPEVPPLAAPPVPDAAAHIKDANHVALEGSVGALPTGTPPLETRQNVGQLADQDAAPPLPETPSPMEAPEIGADTKLDEPLVAPSVERKETAAVPPEFLIEFFRGEADSLEKRAQELRKSADDLEARTNREAA